MRSIGIVASMVSTVSKAIRVASGKGYPYTPVLIAGNAMEWAPIWRATSKDLR